MLFVVPPFIRRSSKMIDYGSSVFPGTNTQEYMRLVIELLKVAGDRSQYLDGVQECNETKDAVAFLNQAVGDVRLATALLAPRPGGSWNARTCRAAASMPGIGSSGQEKDQPWAYAVVQPVGAEFDYLVFPEYGDAESHIADDEEGKEREIIKLFPRVSPLTNNAAPQAEAPDTVQTPAQGERSGPAGAAPVASSNPQAPNNAAPHDQDVRGGESPTVISNPPSAAAPHRVSTAATGETRGALLLAQSALRRWTDLYAHLQNESGERVSRVLDYNLPPADHVKALEAVAEALRVPVAVGRKTEEFSNPSTEGDNDEFVPIETYNSLLESHAELERRLSASAGVAHTDHPSRHWDRTCPACIQDAGAHLYCEHCKGPAMSMGGCMYGRCPIRPDSTARKP